MLEAAWTIVVESFGFDLVDERGRAEAKILEQLRAAKIAARAGLTTGAFYNWWANREQFLDDFLDYALSVERSPTLARLLELAEQLEGEPLVRRTLMLARADLETIAANPSFAIQTHLWSLMRSRPDIQSRMAKMYEDYRSPMMELFERLLAEMDREIRPPFTLEQFGNALVALAEGFTMQVVAGGSGSPGGEDFGMTVLSLVPVMTRPRGDAETMFDVLEKWVPELAHLDGNGVGRTSDPSPDGGR